MLETLLRTKLYVPSVRPNLVPRPQLIERLNQGLQPGCRLTLVSAPAGFGKTTLVASFVTACGAPVAWLSLDKDDNQAKRFQRYLITALQEANHNIGDEAKQLLGAASQAPPEALLTSLINDLDAVNEQIVLVLDDYQFISAQDVHDEVVFLLDHCPETFHLVIASRSDPPFPLPRLRARSQMVELRAADLRFTEPETSQFLNNVMDLHLDAKSIALLEEKAEGWVAGLQMAALSMRHRKDVSGFIAGFSGTNRFILDYLLEEVLASQPTEIQRFLLHTSILERLTGPLCDAVLGDDKESKVKSDDRPTYSESLFVGRSLSILAYLEQSNLFLVSLDDERTWYRFHHLFADLLHARLQQTHESEEIKLLHTRAAQWYEKNGHAYEAIHHASLTSDDEWVERLIEQNYMEMFQRKDSASIWAWTGELSEELIIERPKLSIHEAMSRSWLGQLDDADRLLDEAEKRILAKASTPETGSLLGHLAYVRSRVTAMRGDFQQAIQLGLAARENTPPGNYALLGGIGVMLGYGYFLAGDFANATQTLAETIETGVASGAVNTTIGAYCVLARLYAIQGQLNRSYEVYQAAEKFAHDMGGQHRGAMSIIDVGIAEVLYEWNDLESALAHMKQGLDSIPFWGKADDIALAHTTYSRIRQAQGNMAGAAESIEEGTQVIRSNGVFSEARDSVVTAQVRLWLAQGNSLAAGRWAGSFEDGFSSEDLLQFENELVYMTLARVYAAQNRLDEALGLLTRLQTNALAAGRTGRLISITIINALAMQEMGESGQALAKLTRSLALAEPGGYIRIFLDEGEPLRMLLAQWLAHASADPLREYGSHLLAQFDAEPQTSPATPENATQAAGFSASSGQSLVELLSPRELEVLHLIAQGKTNKEIARQLVVAPGTVKAHTSSIYRKLDVANRTEAVARARQVSILP